MASTSTAPLPIPFSRAAIQRQFPFQCSGGSVQAAVPNATNAPSASSSLSSSSASCASVGASLSSRTSTSSLLPSDTPGSKGVMEVEAQSPPPKVKSTADKRALAKAAAASRRAQQQSQQRASSAASPSATSPNGARCKETSSAGSPTPTPGDELAEWVVPQRAKPGRKPSKDEPLTKRQAQNRASQRAFRERKQTHVATLEAKVAEYEAEKLTRDVKERDARRGLEELVDKLKAENSALESRVQELEAVIRQMQSSQQQQSAPQYQQLSYPPPGVFYPSMTSRPHPCLQAGCRAPSHEAVPLNERRKRPLPTRTPSSPNKVQHEQDIPNGPSPTGSNFSTSRFGAMSIATALSPPMESSNSTLRSRLPQSQQRLPALYGEAPASPSLMAGESNDIEMDRDCGFCTDSTPCLCRGEAVLDLTGIDEEGDNDESISTSRWMSGVDQMVKIEEEDDSQLMASSDVTRARPTTATVGNESRYSSGSSMPVSSLLARPRSVAKPKLWAMTPATEEAKIEPAPTTVNRATTSYGNKLWWTQPLSSTGTMTKTTSALCTWTPAAAPTADAVAQSSAAGVTTAEEVAAAEALCSGDPSNCPACETDPALAAFCEAVGEGDEDGEEGDGTGDDTSTRPIRRASAASSLESSISATGISAQGVEKQSTSSGRPAMAPRSLTSPTAHKMIPMGIERSSSYTVSNPNEHGGYSAVPDAFRQIRSHPGFPKWQGGLNLLADVVSGRGSPQGTGAEPRTQAISSASTSAASSRPFARAKALNFVVDEQQQQERRARHPSVEIVSHTRQTSLVESGDRNVMDDSETEAAKSTGGYEDSGVQEPSTASTAGTVGRPQNSISPLGSSHDGIISNHHKRRRLYLKNDRVEEALRLLDNGCGASGSQGRINGEASRGGGARVDGMTTVEIPCGECPCPCPWAQQQQQQQQRKEGGNARQ